MFCPLAFAAPVSDIPFKQDEKVDVSGFAKWDAAWTVRRKIEAFAMHL